MPQRIDDRRPDPAIDRMMQERQREDVNKKKQQDFSKKIDTQKASTEQSKGMAASNSEIGKAVIRQSKDAQAQAYAAKEGANSSKETTSSAQSTAKGSLAKSGNVDKSQKKDIDSKRDAKKEESKTVKSEKQREDIALDIAVKQKQDKDPGDGDSGSDASDEFFQQSVNLATQGMNQPVETQAAAAPTQIPDAVINQLVNQVYLGIDKKGLQNLIIEFKDGVLNGSQVAVSSKDGKVNLRFTGLDSQSKALMKNSKDEIQRRLQTKNLKLAEFVIG
jgi:hypothetical protein